MKSLKTTLFIVFVALSLVISFGVGIHISGLLPLIRNGSVTGFLLVDYEVSYVDSLHQKAYIALIALIVSMVIAAVIAVAGALIFSSIMIKPINQVTTATNELAQAHFDIDIPITSKNEIGEQQKTTIIQGDSQGIKKESTDIYEGIERLKSASGEVRNSVSSVLDASTHIADYLEYSQHIVET